MRELRKTEHHPTVPGMYETGALEHTGTFGRRLNSIGYFPKITSRDIAYLSNSALLRRSSCHRELSGSTSLFTLTHVVNHPTSTFAISFNYFRPRSV